MRPQNRPGDVGETCGVSSTFGSVQSRLSGGSGSRLATSSTAPRSRPSASARASAGSSTSAPRPTFTTIARAGSNAIRRASSSPSVSGVLGAASTTGAPWGMALKVSDGAGRALAPAATGALARQGVRVPEGLSASPVTDLRGEGVGEMLPLP